MLNVNNHFNLLKLSWENLSLELGLSSHEKEEFSHEMITARDYFMSFATLKVFPLVCKTSEIKDFLIVLTADNCNC